MSFTNTDVSKDRLLEKSVECDICRQWLGYCLLARDFDKRVDFWEANKDHIETHSNEIAAQIRKEDAAEQDAREKAEVSEREARQSFGKATLSGKPPEQVVSGAPAPVDPQTGMHKDYWVLPAEDRAKGFIRPVRTSYIHEKCGSSTRMNIAIAETYARNPGYYGRTFCASCGGHYPVGSEGEFHWPDGSKVGS
jgi:hypothetical protein